MLDLRLEPTPKMIDLVNCDNSPSHGLSMTWRAVAEKRWKATESCRSRTPPINRRESAERDGLGETGFAGFLVLAVHVFGGLGKGHHSSVEIDPVPGGDFVAGDLESGPRLDGAKGAALDAGNLHVTSDRVAGHA